MARHIIVTLEDDIGDEGVDITLARISGLPFVEKAEAQAVAAIDVPVPADFAEAYRTMRVRELKGIIGYIRKIVDNGFDIETGIYDNLRASGVAEAEARERSESQAWEAIFSTVFSDTVGTRASALIVELRAKFKWDDPDSSYKEDVLAYMAALNECETWLGLIT